MGLIGKLDFENVLPFAENKCTNLIAGILNNGASDQNFVKDMKNSIFPAVSSVHKILSTFPAIRVQTLTIF